jgi:hypothetical protein
MMPYAMPLYRHEEIAMRAMPRAQRGYFHATIDADIDAAMIFFITRYYLLFIIFSHHFIIFMPPAKRVRRRYGDAVIIFAAQICQRYFICHAIISPSCDITVRIFRRQRRHFDEHIPEA